MTQNQLCPASVILCFVLAVAFALTGCNTTRDYGEAGGSAALSRQTVEKELREQPFVIGVDDLLHVYVRHSPEVSGEFIVGAEGTIFVPLLGNVQAADLTKAELQKSLAEKLSKFIINPEDPSALPEVAVGISQYMSKKVYVIGEVTRPGPVPMKANILTVWDAIVEAGLPLRTAALWRVHVITPDVEQPVVKRVNLRRIMYSGKFDHNDFLKPGDIVVVPSTAAASLGSYLGQILAPARQSRSLVEVYDFFKNKSYFLDTEYGRYDRTSY
ncbi:polysaccharide export protein [bacterium]|nr:polysaccharide export protein [bacterium]